MGKYNQNQQHSRNDRNKSKSPKAKNNPFSKQTSPHNLDMDNINLRRTSQFQNSEIDRKSQTNRGQKYREKYTHDDLVRDNKI